MLFKTVVKPMHYTPCQVLPANRFPNFQCRETRRFLNPHFEGGAPFAPMIFLPTLGMERVRHTMACQRVTFRCEAIWPSQSCHARGKSSAAFSLGIRRPTSSPNVRNES